MTDVHVVHLVPRDLRDDPRALRAAHAAVEAGYAVTAICMLPPGRKPADVPGVTLVPISGGGLSSQLRSSGAPAVRTGGLRNVRALGRVARQLSWALRVASHRTAASIVHAHDLETLPAALALSHRAGARVIYDAHELYLDWDNPPSQLYRRYCLLVERIAAKRAFAWLTVGDAIAEVLTRRYGVVPTVVLNVPEEARQSAPAVIPTEDSARLRAVYQGIYASGRGLEALVDAARLVPEIDVEFRGFGPLEQELRRRADGAVAFLDPAPPDQMVASLQGAQIGLVPYLPTTLNSTLCLPNKLFEYLAAGLAVAASDLPELRRVISATRAGELFTPGDHQAIATALRALADPARLRDARTQARAAAAGPYAWAHQRSALLDVYERVCAA